MTLRALAAVAALVSSAAFALPTAQERSYLVTVIPETPGPVTDLTAKDFTVRENGEARTVTSAQRPPFPLAVSLLVDTTQPPLGMSTVVRDLRAALASFVSSLRASSPGVKIQMMEVASGATMAAGFDATPEELDAAIQKLFPAHPSDAVLLEAIGTAARALIPMQTPRRAIVIIDFNSSESLNETTMKRMTQELTQSGASVWSVSLRLPRSSSSRREGALNLITKNSGGLRIVGSASSGLEAQLKQIADSLASQYLVAFARPGAGPVQNLTIESSRGLKVHPTLMSR